MLCAMTRTVHHPSSHLLTSSEAAARSGCSQATITRMAKCGALRVAQVAGAETARPVRLFDPADVDALAAERIAEHRRIIETIRAAGKAAK